MRLYFEIAGNQIDGARDYQEDAFLNSYLDVGEDPKGAAVVIMADGMGGHAAGNIASNLVVNTFNKTFAAGFGKDEIPNLLRIALAKANGALSESIRETPALDGMGCTMVAGVFHAGKTWWVSVGDSHLYLLRDQALDKKNEDHSYGGYLDRMAKQGMEIEPEPGLSRNMLMSAMTGDDIAEVDCPNSSVQLLPGDRLIIASDGLDTLSTGTILQMSAWSKTPRECVEALLKAVEDVGKPRQDNTTVIVIDAQDRDADGAPAAVPPSKARSSVGDTQAFDATMFSEQIELKSNVPLSQTELADTSADDESVSAGRIVAIVLILAILVGGAGGGVWYFTQDEAQPLSGVETAIALPPPVPGPSPTRQSPKTPAPISAPTPAPRTAESTELRDKLTDGSEGPVLVIISGGVFQMGTNLLANPDQNPKHTVTVQSLAVGKYEVMQREYEIYMKATGGTMPKQAKVDGKYPVTNVSWSDAVKYTEWLSEQTGEVYRLLSEAEWEYVASTGNEQSFWWGYGMEAGRAHCVTCGSDFTTRHPTKVGRFEPNPFGLYDTAGNVLEWVIDCYNPNYSGAPVDGSAWVEDAHDCRRRVVRGGAYNSPGDSLKSQKRSASDRQKGRRNIGFRVAREL